MASPLKAENTKCGKGVGQPELTHCQWGLRGTATLGKSVAVSWKVKYEPIIWPSHFHLRDFPKINGSTCPHILLDAKVHSSFSCEQNLETTQMSINRWTEKKDWFIHAVGHTCDTHDNRGECRNDCAEKPEQEEHILYDPIHVKSHKMRAYLWRQKAESRSGHGRARGGDYKRRKDTSGGDGYIDSLSWLWWVVHSVYMSELTKLCTLSRRFVLCPLDLSRASF